MLLNLSGVEVYQIGLFDIRPEPDPDLYNSFFGSQYNTPGVTNASSMLSAAIKRQYSSVLPLLRHCLPVFDEICGMAIDFVFFVRVTLRIHNKSVVLVLSVIN